MEAHITSCIKKRSINLLQAAFLFFLSCFTVLVLNDGNHVFSSILLHSQGTEQCSRDAQNNTEFFSTSCYSLSQYLIDKLVINSNSHILQLLILTFPAILFPGAVRQVFSYSTCIPRAPPVC
jgi:hypothetical protein